MSKIKILILILLAGLLMSCGQKEPTVTSPFSRLDTVNSKPKEKEEEPEKEESDGSSVKSPFSNLDKK